MTVKEFGATRSKFTTLLMRALRRPHHDATSTFGLPAGDFRRLMECLADAQRVLVYSGSGLSADSGLPTYRGAGEHLWSDELLKKVATLDGFGSNAQYAREWYEVQALKLGFARPHAGHAALKAMESEAHVTHVTQNVDRLLEEAGCQTVLHVHGTFDAASCMACGKHWRAKRPPLIHPCPNCGNIALRPGIVFQREAPPEQVLKEAYVAARSANIVLVVGTPAEMYPAAAIVEAAHACGVPVCVVNPEWCENLYYAQWQLFAGAAQALPLLLEELRRVKAQRGRQTPWHWRWLLGRGCC